MTNGTLWLDRRERKRLFNKASFCLHSGEEKPGDSVGILGKLERQSDDAPAVTAPSIATKKPVKSKWEAVKVARGNNDVEYDGDSVLDPREVEQGRYIEADLENAAVFLGNAGLGDTSSYELDILISTNPRTTEDF
ncbi:hypothetical protein DFH29DRAFT_879207 [Suillus ampliporus]|nr:hypothetical protein DFH29DRAFT_879207 [Suillus ampliporus]